MNKVQKKIYEEVVKPALDNIPGNLVATVKEFDNLSQTGTIEMSSPLQKGVSYMYNVPVSNVSGIKQPNPFPGDKVMVTFLGANHRFPVILGTVDSKHFLFTRNEKESHFRSGSNITDIYNQREGEGWS